MCIIIIIRRNLWLIQLKAKFLLKFVLYNLFMKILPEIPKRNKAQNKHVNQKFTFCLHVPDGLHNKIYPLLGECQKVVLLKTFIDPHYTNDGLDGIFSGH